MDNAHAMFNRAMFNSAVFNCAMSNRLIMRYSIKRYPIIVSKRRSSYEFGGCQVVLLISWTSHAVRQCLGDFSTHSI